MLDPLFSLETFSTTLESTFRQKSASPGITHYLDDLWPQGLKQVCMANASLLRLLLGTGSAVD